MAARQLWASPPTSRASTSRRSRRWRQSGAPSLETKVFKALTYAQLGRKADAAREVEAILKEKPDFTARGWIANDIMEPGGSSETLFLDGARKAGLPIDQPAPTN